MTERAYRRLDALGAGGQLWPDSKLINRLRDESCRLEGTWMNSSQVEEGILEKAVSYIHHLQEQEEILEQEGE